MPNEEPHWLDKIIEEQAACYRMPVEKFKRMMSGAAEAQEKIESGEWKEPRKEA